MHPGIDMQDMGPKWPGREMANRRFIMAEPGGGSVVFVGYVLERDGMEVFREGGEERGTQRGRKQTGKGKKVLPTPAEGSACIYMYRFNRYMLAYLCVFGDTLDEGIGCRWTLMGLYVEL